MCEPSRVQLLRLELRLFFRASRLVFAQGQVTPEARVSIMCMYPAFSRTGMSERDEAEAKSKYSLVGLTPLPGR